MVCDVLHQGFATTNNTCKPLAFNHKHFDFILCQGGILRHNFLCEFGALLLPLGNIALLLGVGRFPKLQDCQVLLGRAISLCILDGFLHISNLHIDRLIVFVIIVETEYVGIRLHEVGQFPL